VGKAYCLQLQKEDEEMPTIRGSSTNSGKTEYRETGQVTTDRELGTSREGGRPLIRYTIPGVPIVWQAFTRSLQFYSSSRDTQKEQKMQGDFDFEKANEKFEEKMHQLSGNLDKVNLQGQGGKSLGLPYSSHISTFVFRRCTRRREGGFFARGERMRR